MIDWHKVDQLFLAQTEASGEVLEAILDLTCAIREVEEEEEIADNRVHEEALNYALEKQY